MLKTNFEVHQTLESTVEMKLMMKFYLCLNNSSELWEAEFARFLSDFILKCLNRERRKIYHLCHNHNQPGLSHERRLAAHVRSGDEHACALTVNRCLLVAVIVLENATTMVLSQQKCPFATKPKDNWKITKTLRTYISYPNHCVIWNKIPATECTRDAGMTPISNFQERLLSRDREKEEKESR